MSQVFTDDCFETAHAGEVDLQAFKDNMAALKSSFSGTGAPSNQVPGQIWFDTTNKLPKIRNNGDTAWLGMMAADNLHKLWVYRNTAPDGWAIDSSVTDKVLALKGGYYGNTGGTGAGSWAQSGHYHGLGGHVHGTNAAGISVDIIAGLGQDGGASAVAGLVSGGSHAHGNTGGPSGGSDGPSDPATWRPAAAVGTLQYMTI
jgi:hypothetical protein